MLHLLVQPQKKLKPDLKTNNTQNCQKIELYESWTIKDLKKPHSSRHAGGESREDSQRCGMVGEAVVVVEQMVPHLHVVDKSQEGYLGCKQSQQQARLHSPGCQHWEDKSPLLLAVKTSGDWGGRKSCHIFTT